MKSLLIIKLVFLLIVSTSLDAYPQLNRLKNKLMNNSKNSSTSKELEQNKDTERLTQDSYITDDGITDDIHNKHLGEIVFSKTPILKNAGKEEQLIKTFKLGDDIFFRAYLSKSFYNKAIEDNQQELLSMGNFRQTDLLWFEVNGAEVGRAGNNSFEPLVTDKDHFTKWTSLSNSSGSFAKCLNPEPKYSSQISFNYYVAPILKQGENTVKVFLSFEISQVKIVGTESENLTNEQLKHYSPAQPVAVGEMKIIVNNIADIKKHLFSNGLIPKSEQNNPALEKEIIAAYNGDGPKPIKVILLNSDWEISTELGTIVKRYIPVVMIVPKSDNFNAYGLWHAVAAQNHMGDGKYGKIKIETSIFGYDVPAMLFK